MEVIFYTDLDELPIYNWYKISETTELKYLVKSGTYTEVNYNDAVELFEKLQQDYINLFGTNQDSEYLMVLLKRKIKLTADYILTARRDLLNQINLLRVEIDFILKENEEGSNVGIYHQLAGMGKFMGYRLPPKETTVSEFKAIIEEMLRTNKTNNKK